MASNEPKGDYEIGYGRTPRHTRYQKGQTGNRHGRPKGSPNLATVLAATIAEEVVVVENGKRRRTSKLAVAVRRLVDKATRGNPRSMQQLLALTQWVEGRTDALASTEAPLTDGDHEVIAAIYQRLKLNDGNAE